MQKKEISFFQLKMVLYLERLVLTTNSTNVGAQNDPQMAGTAGNASWTPKQTMQMPKGTRFAVENVSFTLSYSNITTANNTFGYRTAIGNPTKTVTLTATGNYGISDINNALAATMFANGDYGGTATSPTFYASLSLQSTSGQVQANLSNSFCLDFTLSSLWQLLGLSSAQVISANGITLFPNKTVVNSINTLLLLSNLSNNTWLGSNVTGVLASIVPNVVPWGQQTYTPFVRQWQTLTLNPISVIQLQLSDQWGNLLNLNGQPLTVTFVFDYPPENPLDQLSNLLKQNLLLNSQPSK